MKKTIFVFLFIAVLTACATSYETVNPEERPIKSDETVNPTEYSSKIGDVMETFAALADDDNNNMNYFNAGGLTFGVLAFHLEKNTVKWQELEDTLSNIQPPEGCAQAQDELLLAIQHRQNATIDMILVLKNTKEIDDASKNIDKLFALHSKLTSTSGYNKTLALEILDMAQADLDLQEKLLMEQPELTDKSSQSMTLSVELIKKSQAHYDLDCIDALVTVSEGK